MDSDALVTREYRTIKLVLVGLGITLAYVLAAELGLQLAVVHNNVTAVWPPSGIALGALLLFGIRLWPAITVGAIIVDVSVGLPLLPASGIAMGNTLAAIIGLFLVKNLAGMRNPLDNLRGLMALVAGGGLMATTISATIGAITLVSVAPGDSTNFATIWLTWWLGDATGVLIVTPLILTWRHLPVLEQRPARAFEAAFLLTSTVLIAQLVFGRYSPLASNHYPLAFLPLFILAWSALRFGRHGATLAIVLTAGIAIWGSVAGYGPFVRPDLNDSLLLLQSFMGVTGFTTLLLAVILNERQSTQAILEQHHREKASNLAEILEQSLNEIYVFDSDSLKFLHVNQGARNNLGFSLEELRNLTPLDLKPEYTRNMFRGLIEPLLNGTSKRIHFNTVHCRKDGSRYPVEAHLQLSQPGGKQAIVAIILDVSERHAVQEKLNHLAHHDPLTDLPNRLLFDDRLTHALQRNQRTQQKLALMFLDLDGFKKINDSLGHPSGDELLKQVAQRLLIIVREGDTVARLGGDEFTVILESISESNDVPDMAGRILQAISKPFNVAGHEVFLGASIGISIFPKDGKNVTSLTKHADLAMFQAKKRGGNNYQFYLTEMTAAANERLTIETGLRHALQRNEFIIHYQPQFSVQTNRIVGLEALVRWQHPQQGMIPPNKFIPVAESAGLIEQLGEWVLYTACKQARSWQEITGTAFPVAVNLSGHQIKDNLVSTVRDALKDTGLEPQYLELEITESCAMDQANRSIENLNRLRELGVQLAIDDFGTGYSSMSYLKHLPIDKLKIDRSFISDIPEDSNDTAIVRAILALGHALNLTIIAEGVETQAQYTFLSENSCDVVQGYLLGMPMPAEDIAEILSAKPPLVVVK